MVACSVASSFTLAFTLHHSFPPFPPHTFSCPTFSFCVSFRRHACSPLSSFTLSASCSQTLFVSSLLPSIHPSVSWQKMSHASSWEAKTLSPSLSKYIFSILLLSCLSTSLSPSSSLHTSPCSVPPSVSLHLSALFCCSTTKLIPPSPLNFCHSFVSLCQSESHIHQPFMSLSIPIYISPPSPSLSATEHPGTRKKSFSHARLSLSCDDVNTITLSFLFSLIILPTVTRNTSLCLYSPYRHKHSLHVYSPNLVYML